MSVKRVARTTVAIVDPRIARTGRYVTSRRQMAEFSEVCRALEAEMAVRKLDGWQLVASWSVASHCWMLFACKAEEVASRGTEA